MKNQTPVKVVKHWNGLPKDELLIILEVLLRQTSVSNDVSIYDFSVSTRTDDLMNAYVATLFP